MATASLPAQALSAHSNNLALPKRPSTSVQDGIELLAPSPLADLTSACVGHLLQLAQQTARSTDSVLAQAQARLLDGERTALSEAGHGMRRMQAVVAKLGCAAEIAGATLPTSVDCNRLLTNVSEELGPLCAETGGRVIWSNLPSVRTLEPALRFLFRELIENALNYRRADLPEVRIAAQRQPTGWMFSVDDNGIGMNPCYWNSVFNPFVTVDPRAWRPGLGLAVALQAAERLGGHISIDQSERGGCVCHFFVPDSIPR